MDYMKHWCAVLAFLLLCSGTALAEVNTAMLESTENAAVFSDDNGVNTVIRPEGQPYFGEIQQENTMLCTYVDYVEMPDMDDTVFIRLSLALETWEPIAADRIGIRVGKENYIFDVSARNSEYDMTYYEDYVFCLTDKSLPMLKTMASGKTDVWDLTFYGAKQVFGSLHLDHTAMKKIYNRYVDAKGNKQGLESFRDIWPCVVEKVK